MGIITSVKMTTPTMCFYAENVIYVTYTPNMVAVVINNLTLLKDIAHSK